MNHPAPQLGHGLADPRDIPGSKDFVQARFGPQATFGRRFAAHLVDGLVTAAVILVPLVLGMVLLIQGIPETTTCGVGMTGTCEVPGTGSGGLVAAGAGLMILSAVAGLAFEIWNQAVRMSRTGQSLGRKAVGITVVNARSGERLTMGPAFLKALVSGLAGFISAVWMLFDDDDRTLSDKVGDAAVIRTTTGGES